MAWGVPELLAPLDPPVELLDPRLDRAAGHRQARLAITPIVHPRGVVAEIPTLTLQDTPGVIRLRLRVHRRVESALMRRDARDHLGDSTTLVALTQSRPVTPAAPAAAWTCWAAWTKSRIGSNEPKCRFWIVQLYAWPSLTKARALAAKKPLSSAAAAACQPNSSLDARLASPVRKRSSRRGGSGRGRIGFGHRGMIHRRRDRPAGHGEALGQLGLRVRVGGLMRHPQEDGGLGFPPGGVVNARAGVGLTSLDAAPVDQDHLQGDRRAGRSGRGVERLLVIRFGALLPLIDQFVADLLAQGLEMPWRDGEVGVDLQDAAGFLEGACGGGGGGGGGDRSDQDAGAIAAMLEPLSRSFGGKRLGGSASRSVRLRAVRSIRPGSGRSGIAPCRANRDRSRDKAGGGRRIAPAGRRHPERGVGRPGD